MLLAEPTLRSRPPDLITSDRDQWRTDRDTAAAQLRARSTQLDADATAQHRTHQHETTVSPSAPDQAHVIRR